MHVHVKRIPSFKNESTFWAWSESDQPITSYNTEDGKLVEDKRKFRKLYSLWFRPLRLAVALYI